MVGINKKLKAVNSNKGSALYYVMVMLIIVTLILSGTLYASYRNAVMTTNYSNSEKDFIKCDSALEALRGQISARLDGKEYPGLASMTGGNTNAELNIFKFAENNYFLSIEPDNQYYSIKGCIGDLNNDGELEFSGQNIGGFIVEQVDIKDANNNWVDTCLIIKNVTVEYKTVRVTADIVINILPDSNDFSKGSFENVVFQNYKVYNVSPETETPDQGGGN